MFDVLFYLAFGLPLFALGSLVLLGLAWRELGRHQLRVGCSRYALSLGLFLLLAFGATVVLTLALVVFSPTPSSAEGGAQSGASALLAAASALGLGLITSGVVLLLGVRRGWFSG
jgi:hypothetical protein